MRTIGAAVLLAVAALAAPAEAQSTYISGHRGGHSWSATITRVVPGNNSARVIRVPTLSEDEQAESDYRLAQWEKRCEPRIVVDNDGVSVYHYKAGVVGCSSGKWRD